LDWLQMIREQTTVVRSTLKCVNQTLHDVSNNELTIIREQHQILKFMTLVTKKLRTGTHILLCYSH
jgi:hypothetical protein